MVDAMRACAVRVVAMGGAAEIAMRSSKGTAKELATGIRRIARGCRITMASSMAHRKGLS